MIKTVWEKIPPLWRIPVLIGLGLLGFVLLSYVWAGAWNGVGNWWYHHSENAGKKEITEIKAEIVESKKVATEAVQAYEDSKQIIADERKKREAAEKNLADKTKNTDQKIAAYEAAVSNIPTHTPPESDDELCQRARSLGLAVQCN